MPPSSFTILGVTLHLYGAIIGLSVLLGWFIIERKSRRYDTQLSHSMERMLLPVLFGATLGARLWHVGTDYALYQEDFWQIFAIWNGGLSIFGGLLGGIVSIFVVLKIMPKRTRNQTERLKAMLDLAVFGLPFGQALGRWANYVNQELYGLPTSLPWGIRIAPENRVVGYEQFEWFHPLFLYESIALVLFGLIAWWHSQSKYKWELGSGKYALVYVTFYSGWRIILDFLRLQKTLVGQTALGINQAILLVVFIGCALLLMRIQYRQT